MNIDGEPENSALQRLRESEELYARAFLQNPIPMTLTDAVSERFTEANLAFFELSGFFRSDIIGRSSEQLGLWDDRTLRTTVAAELAASGRSGPHVGGMRTATRKVVQVLVHFRLLEASSRPYVLSAFVPAL